MRRPLEGLRAVTSGPSVAVEVAGWLLTCLGASVGGDAPHRTTLGGRPAGPKPLDPHVDVGEDAASMVRLVDPDDSCEPGGLPRGAVDYASGVALAAGALVGTMTGEQVEVSRREVAAHVVLPAVMAASYGAPTWPACPRPRRLGGGCVSAELTDADEESFARLLQTLHSHDPSEVAERAQEWRLPVLAYARRPRRAPVRPVAYGCGWSEHPATSVPDRLMVDRHAGPPLAGVVVCDLTAIWAGPFATWLLASMGADVWKIEADCRLDGFRGLDGRAIYPDAEPEPLNGSRSAMFNALNRNKRRLNLDLRRDAHREAFLDLVSRSDVVVDSFSPRVMPNLGLARRRLSRVRPDAVTVSMPAFAPGTLRRHWVAYGTGIHAASGLGDADGSGMSPQEPSVTYPDPIAGLTAFATILALLIGRRAGWRPRHVEIPLESATLPLLRLGHGFTGGTHPDGRTFLDDAWLRERGFFRSVCDGAGRHAYPRAPLRTSAAPVADEPAPRLEAS